MKNIMKNVFSLFLVGVVSFSMFNFIVPNRVEAVEENSKGILKIIHRGPYSAHFIISFYNEKCEEVEKIEMELTMFEDRDYVIPSDTESIIVEIFNGRNMIDTFNFRVIDDKVCSNDVIKVTTTKPTFYPEANSECTGGWEQI